MIIVVPAIVPFSPVFLVRPEVAVAVPVAILTILPILVVPPLEHLPVFVFADPFRQGATIDIAPRSLIMVTAIPAVFVELVIVTVQIEEVVGGANRDVQAEGGDEQKFRGAGDDDRRSADVDIDTDIDV
jgi:hypothetical protein